MNGRQRNTTNAQMWEKKNDSNYDGNCTARHCLSGTYEISRRWIFVGLSVHVESEKVGTIVMVGGSSVDCSVSSASKGGKATSVS